MLLLTKLLLTVLTLGYSAIPATFDFNPTHATNPSWTGHARFHVVWQVTTYCLIALGLLVGLWLPIWPGQTGLILALLGAVAAYGGFFTAVFSKRLYGGRNFDPNGVQPFFIRGVEFDVNISLFTPLSILTAVAAWLVFGIVTA